MLGKTERPLAVRKRMFGRAWPLWSTVKDGPVPLWPQLAEKFHVACTVSSLLKSHSWICSFFMGIFWLMLQMRNLVQNDDVATAWLNNAKVREAIHAAMVCIFFLVIVAC